MTLWHSRVLRDLARRRERGGRLRRSRKRRAGGVGSSGVRSDGPPIWQRGCARMGGGLPADGVGPSCRRGPDRSAEAALREGAFSDGPCGGVGGADGLADVEGVRAVSHGIDIHGKPLREVGVRQPVQRYGQELSC